MDLFDGLNPPQREAVEHGRGPLLILAGPGSGKTRVVTRRAAHLARTVTTPERILAITFTNKAAREMRERIEELYGGGGSIVGAGGGGRVGRGMTVCTFHALCAKLLRIYGDRAGIDPGFTIFDRDDRRKLLKQAIEACDLSTSNYSPAAAEAVISNAKNDLLTAKRFEDAACDWRERTMARVYTQYEKMLRAQNGLDFDDLLLRVAIMLDTDADVRNALEDRFEFVLIDEYQDTNAAQYNIARFLTMTRQNVCATGDPDQSIYGWRGANIENILSFERDYADAKVVRLEQNYRSTKHILSAADGLIANNTSRKAKTLWTDLDEGELVRVVEFESADEEAVAVAQDIAHWIADGADAGEIAVFYRVNSLSRALEEALLRGGVRYQVARGVEFYNRREIKDALAYLRVLVNPADETALLRIVNTPPRGIGQTSVNRLVSAARERGATLHEMLTGGGDLSFVGRSASRVREFAELLRGLGAASEMTAADAVAHVVSHSGLRAHYAREDLADDTPSANLDELINAATAFMYEQPEAKIVDWLEHAALVSDVDAVDGEGGPVTLMTLHAAKGLEFERVYIVGVEEGLLPFSRAEDVSDDDEEERRLMFVGITRAKRHLTLSRARYRMIRGITERTVRSRFLDELPEDAVESPVEEAAPAARRRGASAAAAPGGRLPEDIEQWSIGTLVEHPVHGLGQVMNLEGGRHRTRVSVRFQEGGLRSFVLEYADLKRVDFDDVG